MSMNIVLATPEYLKAEMEARYGAAGRRHRRNHRDSSFEIEERAHRRRTGEATRLRRFGAALAR